MYVWCYYIALACSQGGHRTYTIAQFSQHSLYYKVWQCHTHFSIEYVHIIILSIVTLMYAITMYIHLSEQVQLAGLII